MSGMLGQLGMKSETVWGTAVTVDKFLPGWTSGFLARQQDPLISKGIRAGRRTPNCISPGARIVEGTVQMELHANPLATLLRHMFGTINTTGSGPYTHTASPGPLNSKSFTLQGGIAGTAGTVHPFTASGCKIPKWKLSAKSGELAMLEFDVSAKDYVTATALASASYPVGCPFTFAEGSVSAAGTPVATVKEFALETARPMRTGTDGIYIGASTVAEQLETGPAEHKITVTSEFENLTLHDLQNTAVAVVLGFVKGTDTLTVTANAFIEATTPGVEGTDSLNSFSFESLCYGTADATAIQAVLVNAETLST